MYHGIFGSEKEIFGESREWVHKDNFEEQCQLLHDQNFYTISLDEYISGVTGRDSHKKPIVLTFDDGPLCHLKYALPILKKYNFQAVFYIPVAWINQSNRLTDINIKEIAASGMEIGSHSMTHPDFRLINSARIESEISDSKNYLEQLLAKPIVHFSYPKGRYTRLARIILSQNDFLSAVTVDRGVNNPTTNNYLLYRLGMYGHTTMKKFEKLLRQKVFVKYYFLRYAGDMVERLLGRKLKKNIYRQAHQLIEWRRFN